MPEDGAETLIDLSLFEDWKPVVSEQERTDSITAPSAGTAESDPRLNPEPPPPRLVEVAKLNPRRTGGSQGSKPKDVGRPGKSSPPSVSGPLHSARGQRPEAL